MRRSAYSFIDLLIALGILAILLGLTLAAIQRARASASQTECLNNLRQIGLSAHSYAEQHDGRLPRIDVSQPPHLFLDVSDDLFALAIAKYLGSQPTATGVAPSGSPYTYKVTFRCPSDPSYVRPQVVDPRPLISYAANAQALIDRPSLNTTFTDGRPQTILVAEHMAVCNNACFVDSVNNFSDSAYGIHSASFADSYNHAVFPLTSGNPPVSVGCPRPDATFQVRPSPTDCDPFVAQTAHPWGMSVVMADGSCQILSGGIAPQVYWALVTPAAGDSAE